MPEETPTAAEQYIRAKGFKFRTNGDQLNLEVCPFCGADDYKFFVNKNNFLYSCFKGSCRTAGNEHTLKAHLGDRIAGVSSMKDGAGSTDKAESIPDVEAAHQRLLEDDAVLNYLNDERGFDLELVKRFKLGLSERTFGDHGKLRALTYPYFVGTNCVGVKYRTLPQSIDPSAPAKKDMRFTNGRENGLYNQNALTAGVDYIILAEGESDTLALIAAGFENVVGVPGCSGRKVSWDQQLNKPKKIYLCFDNDEAGQSGAYEFATRFGIERFHNIVLPARELDAPDGDRTRSKDLNEWFLAGGTKEEFEALMQGARPFDLEGVTSMDDALAECEQELDANGGVLEPKYKTPWPSLNARLGGAEDGDLVIVLAPPKVGKSTMCLNWADHLVAEQGVSTFFDCYEMTAKRLARKWASFVTKTDDTPFRSQLTKETLRNARAINRSRSADLLFGHTVVKEEKEVFDRIRAVVRRYGVKAVIIDNLQLIADTTLTKGNMAHRTSYISMLTKRFKQIAMELKILVILISQPKRLMEGQVAGSDSTEGSSAPEKDADSMVCLHRNREAKLKAADLEKMGNFSTAENFSPKMFCRVDLSRYAPGGVCTLHFEGAMSWIREYSADELAGAEVRVENSGAITFVNEGEVQAI